MTRTVLLIARTSLAAPALADMAALCAAVSKAMGGAEVDFACLEQGGPSLRDRLSALAGREELLLLPLLVPAEPGIANGIAKRVDRWRSRWRGPVPRIVLGAGLPTDSVAALVAVAALGTGRDLTAQTRPVPEGSVIDSARRRVLICMGGPCTDAGAAGLWHHLRARQDAEKLRTAGDGMMSCRTSCLGPCNLAPVVQVWPEGTVYAGLDEAMLTRVIDGHLIRGETVQPLAYEATGRKQRLRGGG